MTKKREQYTRPEVINLEFHVDPRVTLAAGCKGGGDTNAANGGTTCFDPGASAPCNAINPS